MKMGVRFQQIWFCFGLMALSGWGSGFAQAAEIRVAAASDLQFVFKQLAPLFERQSGHQLRVSFGSSGKFMSQIQQGAPFDLFLSADQKYVQHLHSQGLTQDAGKLYAIGRIVLFAPKGSPLKPAKGLSGLTALLSQKKLTYLAMANPSHAPYGRAAQEALTVSGLWSRLQGHLLLGENAAQATQFALSGSCEGGILPLSLVLSAEMKGQGQFALIPENLHQPLRQRMVLTKGAGAAPRELYQFLQTGTVRQIFLRSGFGLPETEK
ncbi:MAG: molybdate ABC transporter substrate-binding protein [Candidatus Sericytochromatia bacterium]